jgi:predicted nucleic acid-binding protein
LLGHAETAAALHRKLREGSLTPEDHAEVALQLRDDCDAGLWRWLAMGDILAAAAAEKLRTLPANVFIRGADALHLLCAAENGFTEVFSHDKHFLAAAPHFGLVGRDVV